MILLFSMFVFVLSPQAFSAQVSDNSKSLETSADKNYLSGLKLQKEGKLWEALGAYRKAVRQNRQHGNAYFKAGQVRYALKDFKSAGINFRHAERLGCDSLNLFKDMAAFYRETGQLDLAEKYVRIFKEKSNWLNDTEQKIDKSQNENNLSGKIFNFQHVNQDSSKNPVSKVSFDENFVEFDLNGVSIRFNWKDSKIGSKVYFGIKNKEKIIEDLEKNIFVKKVEKTDILEISVKSSSPNTAQKITDSIANNFIKTRIEQKQQTLGYFNQFLDERLQDITKKLKESEENLRIYQGGHSLLSIDENASFLINYLNTLEKEKLQVEIDLFEYENKMKDMKERLEKQKYVDQTYSIPMVQNKNSTPFAELFQELAEIELQRLELLQRQKESHPEVVSLTERINKIQENLANYNINTLTAYDIIINTLKGKEQNLYQLIDQYSKKIQELPEHQAKLVALTREKDSFDKMYHLLLDKREGMKMAALSEWQDLVILDSASKPTQPIIPAKKRNLVFGFCIGILFGLFTILFQEFHESKITNVKEIENHFPLPVLTVVPKYSKNLLITIKNATRINDTLVGLMENEPAQKESYRNLRTKLLNIFPSTLKTMLFTSIKEGVGKTTIVANFSVSLASMGKRILVIDCDLKKSQLANQFKINNVQLGLGDYLSKNNKITLFHPFELSPYRKLKIDVIPAGLFQESSSELLGKQRMKDLIRAVQSKYDYILLDTPPLTGLVDTFVLSKIVKNVILVVRPHITPKDGISWALKELDQSNANVLGFVFNEFDCSKSGFKYQYGYGYKNKNREASNTEVKIS